MEYLLKGRFMAGHWRFAQLELMLKSEK